MTLAERNIHINDLQIDHAAYAKLLANKLSYGTACEDDLDINAKIHFMIRLWYRYEPLTDAEDAAKTQTEQETALDAQNCLTYAQMCSLKRYLKQLMSTCR